MASSSALKQLVQYGALMGAACLVATQRVAAGQIEFVSVG
jgi:hypothetical protein